MYVELGDAIAFNLAVFLFEPKETLWGSALYLAGWFAIGLFLLTRLFKQVFDTRWRNVLPGTALTAAALVAFAKLAFTYIPVAMQVFGTTGGMLTVGLWGSFSMLIVGGGAMLTYFILVRRGVPTWVTQLISYLRSLDDHADNRLPG